MIYRIGDRDPVTGLYDVIHPDGSATRNGIKIFNSAHEFGDVVLATERSDGMLILDGVKATVTEIVNISSALGGFGEKPVGYLAGQVFNNEEEVILPTVSIKFAPGSPEELDPDAGSFVVRVKIDRPQRRDLRVKLEFTGTTIAADYTIVGLAADSPLVPIVIIPVGGNFVDITITPVSNVDSTKTIIVTALQQREYRIGQDKSVTATILFIQPSFRYEIRRYVDGDSPGNQYSVLGAWTLVGSGSNLPVTAANIAAYNDEWILITSAALPGNYINAPLFDGFPTPLPSSDFISVDSNYFASSGAGFSRYQFIRQSYRS